MLPQLGHLVSSIGVPQHQCRGRYLFPECLEHLHDRRDLKPKLGHLVLQPCAFSHQHHKVHLHCLYLRRLRYDIGVGDGCVLRNDIPIQRDYVQFSTVY